MGSGESSNSLASSDCPPASAPNSKSTSHNEYSPGCSSKMLFPPAAQSSGSPSEWLTDSQSRPLRTAPTSHSLTGNCLHSPAPSPIRSPEPAPKLNPISQPAPNPHVASSSPAAAQPDSPATSAALSTFHPRWADSFPLPRSPPHPHSPCSQLVQRWSEPERSARSQTSSSR